MGPADQLAPTGFERARTPSWSVPAADGAPATKVIARHRGDSRLPVPGSVITKTYKDQELRLLVLDDGFELDGQRFGSLSEAARHVTGSRWNGWLLWGLKERNRKR